jgi:hypothetical protein
MTSNRYPFTLHNFNGKPKTRVSIFKFEDRLCWSLQTSPSSNDVSNGVLLSDIDRIVLGKFDSTDVKVDERCCIAIFTHTQRLYLEAPSQQSLRLFLQFIEPTLGERVGKTALEASAIEDNSPLMSQSFTRYLQDSKEQIVLLLKRDLGCFVFWSAAAERQLRIPLSSITDITFGKTASLLFQTPLAGSADSGACFVLSSSAMTLCLEAPSEPALDSWLTALQLVMKEVVEEASASLRNTGRKQRKTSRHRGSTAAIRPSTAFQPDSNGAPDKIAAGPHRVQPYAPTQKDKSLEQSEPGKPGEKMQSQRTDSSVSEASARSDPLLSKAGLGLAAGLGHKPAGTSPWPAQAQITAGPVSANANAGGTAGTGDGPFRPGSDEYLSLTGPIETPRLNAGGCACACARARACACACVRVRVRVQKRKCVYVCDLYVCLSEEFQVGFVSLYNLCQCNISNRLK